jgi:hypothetical protein
VRRKGCDDNVIRYIRAMLAASDGSDLSNDDSSGVIVRRDYRGFVEEILLPFGRFCRFGCTTNGSGEY